MEREREIAVLGRDRVVDRDELQPSGNVPSTCTSETSSGTPATPAPEHPAAEIHQLGDAPAVAHELQDLRGDERHRLGVVEAEPARAASARGSPPGGA